MQNVVLVIHLFLALSLIGVVLLQRSEGGGLASSGGGANSGRGTLTAMGKVTWVIAGAFICTSVALTIIAAENSAGASVIDRLQAAPVADTAPASDAAPALGTDLLPPSPTDGAPLVPSGN
jgi:preprotein translocase subunit SecG